MSCLDLRASPIGHLCMMDAHMAGHVKKDELKKSQTPQSHEQIKEALKRLPRNASRILFVKNLPYGIPSEDLFDIFSRYGSIYQIRLGTTLSTRGTAYVVFDDIFAAVSAQTQLSGFQVAGRYLVPLFFRPDQRSKAEEEAARRQQRMDDLEGRYRSLRKDEAGGDEE